VPLAPLDLLVLLVLPAPLALRVLQACWASTRLRIRGRYTRSAALRH